MPKYTSEEDAIQGKKIFCTFEKRPSFSSDETNARQQSSITGNPATATIKVVWKYKEEKMKGK
ncbi:hypothetical protein MUP77_14830 [Candidatus Bathyarchaeota archaeon]|nr:hypothetical protein [Candidatus Bathyarchaeota archaeon]